MKTLIGVLKKHVPHKKKEQHDSQFRKILSFWKVPTQFECVIRAKYNREFEFQNNSINYEVFRFERKNTQKKSLVITVLI